MVATDSIVAADQPHALSSATTVAREVTLLAIAEAVVVTVVGIDVTEIAATTVDETDPGTVPEIDVVLAETDDPVGIVATGPVTVDVTLEAHLTIADQGRVMFLELIKFELS
jgi:hypothetical protein